MYYRTVWLRIDVQEGFERTAVGGAVNIVSHEPCDVQLSPLGDGIRGRALRNG